MSFFIMVEDIHKFKNMEEKFHHKGRGRGDGNPSPQAREGEGSFQINLRNSSTYGKKER